HVRGAGAIAGQLAAGGPGGGRSAPKLRLLAAIAAAGLLLITGYGLRIVGTAALVAVPTALFLAVYLGAMAAAARVLCGPARLAALPGALAVTVMLGFCGWALAVPAAIALAVGWRPRAAVHPRGGEAGGHRASTMVRTPGCAGGCHDDEGSLSARGGEGSAPGPADRRPDRDHRGARRHGPRDDRDVEGLRRSQGTAR